MNTPEELTRNVRPLCRTEQPKTHRRVSSDALALFVAFVRLNPHLPEDDPMLMGVLDAYNKIERCAV